MTDYRTHFATRNITTPQSEPIPNTMQVPNSAGGFAWAVTDWTRLDRFLILGTEGGSYYATERTLTKENAAAVERCIKDDGPRVVDRIVEISQAGRAPKNDPALFALAMCAGLGDARTKAHALAALPKVARIGTHLFHFVNFVEGFRGWGRGLQGAVSEWYTQRTAQSLAVQLIKYQGRDGWTHKDLLRLAHTKPLDAAQAALFRWLMTGREGLTGGHEVQRGKKDAPVTTQYAPMLEEYLPPIIGAFEEAQTADETRLVQLIHEHELPMECIPTDKRSAAVYEALIPHAGITWLYRNLGNLSKSGVLVKGAWDRIEAVVARLIDVIQLRAGRVHPIQVLSALLTYQSGKGVRGKGEWEVVPEIVDAAQQAFYTTFGLVEGAGKRTLLGLDISGSMNGGEVAGVPGLTPRVASAAMAMVTLRAEPRVVTMAFTSTPHEIDLSKYRRLDEVCEYTNSLPMGGTDCALPMRWALQRKIEIDTFIVYTDSETWAGSMHPVQALAQYRKVLGIPARLAVVGLLANAFTIADPNDSGMMDFCGFDSAAPNILTEFSAGRI